MAIYFPTWVLRTQCQLSDPHEAEHLEGERDIFQLQKHIVANSR